MRLVVLFVLLVLLACQPESETSLFMTQLKRLEYSRSADLIQWNKLYQQHKDPAERLQLLSAMGKTHIERFAPFYLKVIKSAHSEALTNRALFALGQLQTASAAQALLHLPFDSLSSKSKSVFLLSLGRSCNKSALAFFSDRWKKGETGEAFWRALALCSRKKSGRLFSRRILADSSFYDDLTTDKAYFAYYAAQMKNLPALLRSLKDGKGLEQKYLLKTLNRLYKQQPLAFREALQNDSTLSADFYDTLRAFLHKQLSWQNKLYAIKLAALASDSLVRQPIYQLTNDKNIHRRVEAFKTLSDLSDSLATEAILSRFSIIKNSYLKGNCLIMLAKIQPQKAYRLIAKELGKGDIYYKGLLLEALGNLSNSLATATLKQYLRVPEPYLKVKAFELLDKMHKIRENDADLLLQSSSLACVYTALDWNLRRQRKLSKETLLRLFSNFNKSADFELQKALIDAYEAEGFTPDSGDVQTFLTNAGQPTILKHLSVFFPKALGPVIKDYNYLRYLPPFLAPDSLANWSASSVVATLNTTKGAITIEVFPAEAPLTCKNFITLANRHFYDNLSFHRVVPDFVIQGGDPLGDGFGGPGYMIPSEENSLPFNRGSVGMATAGFDTGGSQFFICHSEQPHLTGNYTLFGQVKQGMDVVDEIVPGDKILSVIISKGP